VELHVTGERRDLPGGLELSAYRLMQEALTNVRKHANAARADVHLEFGADTLRVTVLDDGAGDQGGEGQGLVGMRERDARRPPDRHRATEGKEHFARVGRNLFLYPGRDRSTGQRPMR
jgi:hypothetical protein